MLVLIVAAGTVFGVAALCGFFLNSFYEWIKYKFFNRRK